MLLLLNVLMAVSATSHLVPDTGILAEAGAALPSLIDHFLAERTSANEALYGRTSTGVNRLNFTANGTKAREQLFQEDGSANRAFINPRGKLRLPRLSAYLRHRVLDAAADFSILIFHLSNAEFQQALGGISPE